MTFFFLFALLCADILEDECKKPVISEFEKAVCVITGCADISEIDSDTFEHLQLLSAKKLKINSAGRVRLQESGLFSAYQIESIMDRRARLGDILSLAELGTVDGFREETVGAFQLFLSFEPSSAPPSFSRWSLDALLGGAWKRADGKDSWQYCSKLLASVGGISAAVACKSQWNMMPAWPEVPGWSVSYDGNGALSRIVAGNYYARFGQGLAQWNGVQMNSYSNPASLMKHPMGITRYASYSPSYAYLGAAATVEVGRWSVSPFVDIGEYGNVRWTAGANASYHYKSGQAGLTAVVPFFETDYKARISADAQYTIHGVVLFGELCFNAGATRGGGGENGGVGGKAGGAAFLARADSSFTAVAGVRFPIVRADCSVRLYSSMYERNVTASSACGVDGGRHLWSGWTSFSYYPRQKGQTPAGKGQLKAQVNYQFKPVDNLELISRFDIRIRPYGEGNRFEFRQNVRWYPGKWSLAGRFDTARCADWSFLGYVEAGWKGICEAYVQTGAFKVDNWADRIYVYQRDVPQSFNVPAMYGRGLWLSAYSVLRPLAWMKIYLRGAVVAYPWARPSDTHRTLSASARLQLAVSF